MGVLQEGSGSFGKLIPSPELAVLESRPVRRQLVIHTHPRALTVRPRVDFFSRRTVFVLQGSTGIYGIRAGFYPVKRLQQALAGAGLELEEHPTLIDVLPRPPFWGSKTPGRQRPR